MRLLIVKGNLDIAAVIERDITIAFRGESLRLFSVPTLESGISALSVFEPHLILFDAALPDGEGFALLDRVRDTSIVTVCLSDRVTEGLVSNVAQYGVFRVLLEPWQTVELSAVVGEALLEARQRRQYQLRQYQFIEQQIAVGHDAAAEENKRLRATTALAHKEARDRSSRAAEAPETQSETQRETQSETQGEEELRVIFTDALGRSVSARADAILFCEAQKNYVLIYQENAEEPLRLRDTLTNVERRLLPFGFFTRVHKSFIAQIPKALDLSSNALLFEGGRKALVSERYYSSVKKALAKIKK